MVMLLKFPSFEAAKRFLRRTRVPGKAKRSARRRAMMRMVCVEGLNAHTSLINE
jgi:hypothetical protein